MKFNYVNMDLKTGPAVQVLAAQMLDKAVESECVIPDTASQLSQAEELYFNAMKLARWTSNPDEARKIVKKLLCYCRIAARSYIYKTVFTIELSFPEVDDNWPTGELLEAFGLMDPGSDKFLDELFPDQAATAARIETWLNSFSTYFDSFLCKFFEVKIADFQEREAKLRARSSGFIPSSASSDEAGSLKQLYQDVKDVRSFIIQKVQKAGFKESGYPILDESEKTLELVQCLTVTWGLHQAMGNPKIFDPQGMEPHLCPFVL